MASTSQRSGLLMLKMQFSIIPGCYTLTLRSTLDPFGLYDDARPWDAVRRLYLVEDTKGLSPTAKGLSVVSFLVSCFEVSGNPEINENH
ncbi:hypothetical protein BGY98DRAFT_98842 [Russula aff. rugulosa BPL654]|nr:hypothetical protein BGY98DRAFT_98842 [Russula aff. rugulosa BPL654]